jgi:hypothetical protein
LTPLFAWVSSGTAEGFVTFITMKGCVMHVRRFLVGSFAALAVSSVGIGVAGAGEVTGPPGADGFATGNPTPIASYVAKSICAFSGLNAYHPGKEGVYPGHVQNYGAIVSQGGKSMAPSPGDACNGHTGELAGG